MPRAQKTGVERKKRHVCGLNPSHLFPKKPHKAVTGNVIGDSWWVDLSRDELDAEAERRFGVNPKSGVVVNTKGILDLD